MVLYLLQTELLSSLVLSMLQQILNDDKADGVRQAAVKSLAILVAFIDDKAKFQNVILLNVVCNYHTPTLVHVMSFLHSPYLCHFTWNT